MTDPALHRAAHRALPTAFLQRHQLTNYRLDTLADDIVGRLTLAGEWDRLLDAIEGPAQSPAARVFIARFPTEDRAAASRLLGCIILCHAATEIRTRLEVITTDTERNRQTATGSALRANRGR